MENLRDPFLLLCEKTYSLASPCLKELVSWLDMQKSLCNVQNAVREPSCLKHNIMEKNSR